MGSGDLTERVAFYSTTTASDGTGGQNGTDVLIRELWANVKKVSAGRSYETGKINEGNQYKITIRYNVNYIPVFSERVYWNEKWYTINSIDTDNSWVTLIVTLNE